MPQLVVSAQTRVTQELLFQIFFQTVFDSEPDLLPERDGWLVTIHVLVPFQKPVPLPPFDPTTGV